MCRNKLRSACIWLGIQLFLATCLSQNTYAQFSGSDDATFNPADVGFSVGDGFDGDVTQIIRQPDGKLICIGDFFRYNGKNPGLLIRLNPDGSIDETFSIGTGFRDALGKTTTVKAIALQEDGKILVGGNFNVYNGNGRFPSNIIRLNTDGSLDESFRAGFSFSFRSVNSINVYPDGKILVGAQFDNTNNNPVITPFARLHPDGTLDSTFAPNTNLEDVFSRIDVIQTHILPDGKLLALGDYRIPNRSNRRLLVRFLEDGRVDESYDFNPAGPYLTETFALQSDGKAIIGGSYRFSTSDEVTLINRLNTDGSLDDTFTPGNGFNDNVYAISVLPDDRILVGGEFSRFQTATRRRVALLHIDGNLDESFDPGRAIYTRGRVSSFVQLPQGQIVVGGEFDASNGAPRAGALRLDADGGYDPLFNVGTGFNDEVMGLLVQEDDKVFAFGNFTSYYGNTARGLVRINPQGSFDDSFVMGDGFNSPVKSIAIAPDNKIIVCGDFTEYNGAPCVKIARLLPDGTLDDSFRPDTAAISFAETVNVQSDGKVLLQGFILGDDQTLKTFLRYNQDGSLDESFAFDGTVQGRFIHVLPDDKLFVGSNQGILKLFPDGRVDTSFVDEEGFSGVRLIFEVQLDGKILIANRSISRIHADGRLDTSFDLGSGFDSFISDIISLPNGQMLVSGYFNNFEGIKTRKIARLNIDGSLDQTFITGEGFGNSNVNALALHREDQVIAAGRFQDYDGRGRNRISRIHGTSQDLATVNSISGRVIADKNANCSQDAGEQGLAGWKVQAVSEDNTFHTVTDSKGYYTFYVNEGSFQVNQVAPAPVIDQVLESCPIEGYSIDFVALGNDTTGLDFAIEETPCALLNVDMSMNRRLRCFRGNTFLAYQNYGSTTAENVRIEVEFSEFMIPISSTVPWTSYDAVTGKMTFELGSVPPGTFQRIVITDSIACVNEAFNQTQCAKASIFPKNTCISPDPNWNQADLHVAGRCFILFDPISIFTIYNRGAGNMDSPQEYRIFADNTLLYQGTTQLNAGDSLVLAVPSQGKSMRIEVDQVAFHPDNRRVSVSVEGCGRANTQISRGFVNQFPQDDDNFDFEVVCEPVVGSYDPNDKLVRPLGFTEQHFVNPGTEMEYTIRFQNTGTAEAIFIRVIDTLSVHWDVSSFLMLSTSHDYALQVQTTEDGQSILNWFFPNIFLPDSTTNEPESHGYIKFKIRPKTDLAIGTQVTNFADIFFDYNDPIRTNTTLTTFEEYMFPEPEVPVDPCTFVSTAEVGDAITTCETSIHLLAEQPTAGKGNWVIVQGSGAIQNPGDTATLVTGLGVGENIFRWEVSTDICVDNFEELTITVNEQPAQPVIQNPDGNVLQSSVTGDSYQWYFEGTLLPEQTSQSFEATETGDYRVTVTQNGCTSELSDVFMLEVTSLETELREVYGFRIHPNPTEGDLQIRLQRRPKGKLRFILRASDGGMLESLEVNGGIQQPWEGVFALTSLPKGLYLLEVQTQRGSFTNKIIRK